MSIGSVASFWVVQLIEFDWEEVCNQLVYEAGFDLNLSHLGCDINARFHEVM